jgi:uncharacterized Zn-binding protein involved in type VI secretion
MNNIAVEGQIDGADTCTGRCSAHLGNPVRTGIIIVSQSDHDCKGKRLARQGDIVIATGCGHTGIIQQSSTPHEADGKTIAKVTDTFTGTFSGTITKGLDNTQVS